MGQSVFSQFEAIEAPRIDQTAIAEQIIRQDADYVLSLKRWFEN